MLRRKENSHSKAGGFCFRIVILFFTIMPTMSRNAMLSPKLNTTHCRNKSTFSVYPTDLYDVDDEEPRDLLDKGSMISKLDDQ